MSRRLDKAAPSSLLDSGALTQSLLLLGQIGETTNLGVLKGFAGVVNLVLEICRTASSNKADAADLASDVGALAMAVAGQVEDLKEEISADKELVESITKICLELEAVHSDLQGLFKRGASTWFVKHSQDEVRLQRLQRNIKHAIDLFSLQSSVRLNSRIKQSEALDAARKGRILDEIRRAQLLAMDEIRIAKQPLEILPPVNMAPGPVLPRMPRHFSGREEEIDLVVTAIIGPTPGRVAVLGPAGIGKTSVASMALFDQRVVENFRARRFFISCDAAYGKDDLLTAISGPLNLRGDRLQKKILQALGDPEHRTLIVLDNFESPWESSEASKKEVESFLVSLCALDALAVIVTMRGSERPAGVKWTRPFLPQLGPLDLLSARRVFLALSDCSEDDAGIDPLLTAIDRVPLAIALMANLTETDNTKILLSRWHEEQSSLLHRTPDRRSSLDVSIGISLRSPRMKSVPEALILLSCLSLLPDGIDNSQIGAIFPNIIGKARRALAVLWQTSLAYNDGNNRTRVLSPIRAHVMLHHQPDAAQRSTVFAYYMGLAGLASDLGGRHGQDIVKRLTPEVGNLHTVVNLVLGSTEQSPEVLRGAVVAAINLSRLLRYTYLGNPGTLRSANVAAVTLGDQVLQADVLYNLAWITLSAGTGGENLDQENLCREALALYDGAGKLDGKAECTWLLGQIYKSRKSQTECKMLYQDALQLAIQSQNRYCQAKCLSNLSEITFYLGDAEAAEPLSIEALKLFRELDHLTNIGMCLLMLGKIAVFRNDHAADQFFREAEAVLKQAGGYHMAGLVVSNQGDYAFARCDFFAAQEIYGRALNIFQEAGAIQSSYAAFVQLSLGVTAAQLDNQTEARNWLEKASAALAKSPFAGYGNLHRDIVYGDLALDSENFEEASTFYHRAWRAAQEIGYPEEEAQCNVKLGTLELAQGRTRGALRHLVAGAAKQRRTKNVKGLSQTLCRLGDCFQSEGDAPTALLLFRAVYPLCRKIEALRDLADCLVGMGIVCNDRGKVIEADALYEKTGGTKGREQCRKVLGSL